MKKKEESKEDKKKKKREVRKVDVSNKGKGGQKALDAIFDDINKDYGAGTIMKLSDAPIINVDTIPTGALSLDFALGCGGVPKGRIIEIFGGESSGKSTLCLSIAKNCQKQGGRVVYIDAENGLDITYAAALGVDVEALSVVQPDYGEQALDITERIVKSNTTDLIIIDSLAALVAKEELDGEILDQKMAPQARMMSKALRRLVGIIGKTRTAVIFINQLRDAIGTYSPNKNYKPTSTPGGRALKFYASVRIEIKVREPIEGSDGSRVGNVVRAKCVKNKCGIPFKEAFFEIIFGKGIKRISAIFDAAETVGAIEKVGNKYIFEGIKLGVGRDAAFKYLKDNKELLATVEKKARELNTSKQEKKEVKKEEKKIEVLQ